MKSDIDIVDDVYNYLRDNADFWSEMSAYGFASTSLVKETRQGGVENIVISVLANGGNLDDIQEAFVNVNVFVKDLKNVESTEGAGEVTTYYENRNRIRPICQIMDKYLSMYGETFLVDLDEQRVLADEATHTHFVNNKVLYKQINL